MANSGSPQCPFTTPGMVLHSEAFVGRVNEIKFIISRLQDNHQPASVTIVGDRQSGKSSLLYHIYQTYHIHIRGHQVDRFLVIYVSLQDANCRTQADFYQTIARETLKQPQIHKFPNLEASLQGDIPDAGAFSKVLEVWKTEGVILVVCLDDFENFLDRPKEFDKDFYDSLRNLISLKGLMLIIASRKLLLVYSKKKKITSDFFNVTADCPLKDLTDEEVMALVQLPKNGLPALRENYRSLAREWGGKNPCLLQIAARCLWEAQEHNRTVDWAKRQFDNKVRGVPRKFHLFKLFYESIASLGDLTQELGDMVDRVGSFGKGLVVIVLLIFALTGLVTINSQQVPGWFFRSPEEPKATPK
ncbi:MAG: ATP-binding protein [Coleofasciculaceae cyanobacterium SM2_1_6]|nr:ATP-binding protein [Coleofasciculaceae cyanobacterium SM2_1_6]